MLLSVDDFGCVPDGRYLSHVSIQAGSAQLSAPGGALRQADVGKHIAIPGAVDLVATVSGLLARKDVASASMEAGGCTLTAVLTGADGFFQARVPEGLRITVAGAGPQGAPLVSDVSEMRSGTTLELADAAVNGLSRAAARAVPVYPQVADLLTSRSPCSSSTPPPLTSNSTNRSASGPRRAAECSAPRWPALPEHSNHPDRSKDRAQPATALSAVSHPTTATSRTRHGGPEMDPLMAGLSQQLYAARQEERIRQAASRGGPAR
jgi:hypothetical protein